VLPYIEADLTRRAEPWVPNTSSTCIRTKSGLRERQITETLGAVAPAYSCLDVEAVRIDANERLGVAVYWAVMRDRFRAGYAQPFWNTGGKGFSEGEARVSLMCETLERVASSRAMHPALIEGTYHDVADIAVDARLLGVAVPGDMTNVVQEWGWCTSLRTGVSKLMHASFLLAPYRPIVGSRLCESDYNGLASGNSRDEAILHALCELIERDVLLRVSYHKPCLQRLSLESIAVEDCQHVLGSLAARNVEVAIWDLSCYAHVTTFGAMIFDAGFVRPVSPLSCGTHPDPAIALSRCLAELCQVRANTIFVTDCAPRISSRSSSETVMRRFFSSEGIQEIAAPHFCLEHSPCPAIGESLKLVLDRLHRDGIDVLMSSMGAIPGALEIVRLIAVGLQPLTRTVTVLGGFDESRFSRRDTDRLFVTPVFGTSPGQKLRREGD
jgi:YcaO-like protein with predicted kinase domain